MSELSLSSALRYSMPSVLFAPSRMSKNLFPQMERRASALAVAKPRPMSRFSFSFLLTSSLLIAFLQAISSSMFPHSLPKLSVSTQPSASRRETAPSANLCAYDVLQRVGNSITRSIPFLTAISALAHLETTAVSPR